MIRRVNLQNFKGFERFSLHVGPHAFMLGPNNAGKSTLISALRATALMIRIAKRQRPRLDRATTIGDTRVHEFLADRFDFDETNLRHEFSPAVSRMEVEFDNGHRVHAVWPDADEGAYYYLTSDGRRVVTDPRLVQAHFPDIGWVPTLSPLDPYEQMRDERHVKRNLSTHLASRHFRNQLYLLWRDEPASWVDFVSYCADSGGRVELEVPQLRHDGDGTYIDVYYREGRTPKELAWAGHGMQIWVQLLLHLYRLRSAGTVVLDEPDVYLHPDWQHALVRRLQEGHTQAILATHSAEMLLEADPDHIVWVDRTRASSIAASEAEQISGLGKALGSRINLALAGALRSKLVLFVEGQDVQILRILAAKLDLRRLIRQEGIAVVSIGGRANWPAIRGFQWVADRFLRGAIQGYVLLDRDYSSPDGARDLHDELLASGLRAHIWKRKEIESYLLEPSVLARCSGLDEEFIVEQLKVIAAGWEHHIYGEMVSTRQQELGRSTPVSEAAKSASKFFREAWVNEVRRVHLCPAKRILADLNKVFANTPGGSATSFTALAREMQRNEIPDEMVYVLQEIERLAEDAGDAGDAVTPDR